MKKNWLRLTIPLCLISFFLAFNYYILKALKNTLIITADGAGAEAIPFVKVWFLFPMSVLLAMGFAWISTRFSLRAGFTTVLSIFLVSYFVFAFVLFPYGEKIHLNNLAEIMEKHLPPGWKGLCAVVRYWSYAFFYVMAECWGAVVYSVLFWGFANEVTKFADAERSYPLLTLAGTAAALAAGPIAVHLSLNTFNPSFPLGTTPWEQSFYALTSLVLACGGAALLVFHLCLPKEILEWGAVKTNPSKPKISFWKSIACMARSKHLTAIALVAFSFNMTINMTEVVWQDQLFKLYPNPNDFNAHLSGITTATGAVSTLLTLFVCRQSLQAFGWTVTAMITPVVALITGALFFGAIHLNSIWGITLPLTAVVLLGSIHICLSFSSKYTLLDTAKELAFIPLEPDLRLKGKAAIDGVGSRMGKASSSIIFQCLFTVIPTVAACTPYIGGILLIMILACLLSVQALGKQMESTTPAVEA